MIVLPIQPGWRKSFIPAATLVLALVSTVVFAAFTSRERGALDAAAAFYVQSGLADIELPRYREYLQQSDRPDSVARLARLERATGSAARPADRAAALDVLQQDRAFERSLRAGRIIAPDDPVYADWRSERRRFEQMTAAAIGPRLSVSGRAWSEPWRFVTYLFVHPDWVDWLAALAVLLLIGPFAEAAAGARMTLLCFAGGGALAGAGSLIFSGGPLTGDWSALIALAAMLAATAGMRSLRARLAFSARTLRIPAVAPLLALVAIEALRGWLRAAPAVDAAADAIGACAGMALAFAFRLRDAPKGRDLVAQACATDSRVLGESVLARQAQAAATRHDSRRARALYKELVELEPDRIEHLCAYLNVAMLGPDETTLQDAALRLLWLRGRSRSEQLRKAFLQLTQPKVLKVLSIDEHLRLARRLVRVREDAAALRVLDDILSDDHLRQLYGRQLADCLLGIHTGYMRRRLTTLADSIRSRLTTYFEAPDHLGGLPPASRPPTTLFTSSPRSRLPPRS